MSQFGIWLIIFGVGSFLLGLFGMEFRLLMWVDMWGAVVGNMIRGGLIALGVVLLLADRGTSQSSE